MPHFFIDSKNKTENRITIDDKENYRHIARALRARKGEKLLLIDENQIQYETIIKEITSDKIDCEIINSYLSERDLDFNLYLAQSPLRSESLLTIIEKATELGVRGVYPVITDNCALQKSIAEKKLEKWQKVMFESSKQCERARIPQCFEVTTIEQLLEKVQFDKVLVLAERSTEMSLKKYLRENSIQKGENVLVIIGPEGGFSQREFDYFALKKLPMLTLGDLILRAETAVIVTLGDIVYEYQG